MEKFLFKKEKCYKINLPNNWEISNFISQYCDVSDFRSVSPILTSFSFDEKFYSELFLSDLVKELDIEVDDIFFYNKLKNKQLKDLSVKQKIILVVLYNLKVNDCILLSLEAMSLRTISTLIFLASIYIRSDTSKTFIFFNFSTTNHQYTNLEVTVVEPHWTEKILMKS